MRTRPDHTSILVGIVLIVAPLIAIVIKFFSPGWMIVILIMGPIVFMAAGYALQIVIASQLFFSTRRAHVPGRARAVAAAWVTSAGVCAAGLFLPDGGDSGEWGSTFQVMLGAYGENAQRVHELTDGATNILLLLGCVAWIGGFVWLVIEWILALAAARAARIASAASTQQVI